LESGRVYGGNRKETGKKGNLKKSKLISSKKGGVGGLANREGLT